MRVQVWRQLEHLPECQITAEVGEAARQRPMVLVQSGRDGYIEIVRARTVSTMHELALLETAAPMEHHLTIASSVPHGLADQFHAAGYPAGRFETLSAAGHQK